MKRITLIITLLTAIFVAVAQIPPAPNPPRLVNDFAGLMSTQQVADLERRLVTFNDSTSNMICVVTVSSLNGMTAQEFAYEIGDKWGVKSRKSGKNNGVVILIKPKNETDGEVRIEVGYDLEAVLPDAFASRLSNDTMIPHFKENDYYGGVSAALDVMLPIIAGEISYKEYEDDDTVGTVVALFFFITILILMLVFFSRPGGNSKNKGNGNSSGKNDIWKWILIGSLLADSQNRDNSNRGGGYDGGYGGFGDHGGFGGFGGSGGFGGGGGGGRW